jgi:hypothetical protein
MYKRKTKTPSEAMFPYLGLFDFHSIDNHDELSFDCLFTFINLRIFIIE